MWKTKFDYMYEADEPIRKPYVMKMSDVGPDVWWWIMEEHRINQDHIIKAIPESALATGDA